jgi:membrane fusion protein (multidrug efflux system)
MHRPAVALGLIFLAITSGVCGAEPSRGTCEVANCRVSAFRRAALSVDVIERGQILAVLRDEVARQALEIARESAANSVELRLAKKISEQATLEFAKASELNRTISGGFSEIEVRKLKLAAEKALLQMEQADFQLQLASLREKEAAAILETYRIAAPFSGVVLQVFKQPGESLSPGEAAFEIANFDVMRVEGFVPVSMVTQLRRGAAVQVEIAGPRSAVRFEGRLKHFAPVVNDVSQEVRVWADVENRDELLKDGLPATMRISLSKPPPHEAMPLPSQR